MAPLRLAALDEILPGQLERGFDRFRAAADEGGVADTGRRMGSDFVGQLFGGLRREETGMRIFELVELLAHGLDDIGMSMAEAGYGGAAGGVEIFLALRVANINAAARNSGRILMIDCPV